MLPVLGKGGVYRVSGEDKVDEGKDAPSMPGSEAHPPWSMPGTPDLALCSRSPGSSATTMP